MSVGQIDRAVFQTVYHNGGDEISRVGADIQTHFAAVRHRSVIARSGHHRTVGVVVCNRYGIFYLFERSRYRDYAVIFGGRIELNFQSFALDGGDTVPIVSRVFGTYVKAVTDQHISFVGDQTNSQRVLAGHPFFVRHDVAADDAAFYYYRPAYFAEYGKHLVVTLCRRIFVYVAFGGGSFRPNAVDQESQ